jgi:pyrroloquinoline quinone biosynthesis protein D
VLVCPEGRVPLNLIAAAILHLCDGSRNRDDVVAEVLRNSPTTTRAAEIREFIDVAIERGWIAEN